MILVAGSTGLLGLEICRRLRNLGEAVRGIVRPGSPRQGELTRLGVEPVMADLKDPVSLTAACRGASAVVSTVNSVGRKLPGDGLESVDRAGQRALIEAARRAGVSRFVYVSVSPGSADCPFVRVKREVETAVRTSFPEWAVLQPVAFMEIWLSPPLGWDLVNGRIRLFGSGTRPVSFVSVQDVAAGAAEAATAPGVGGRDLPIGGPESLSPLEIVRLAETVFDRRMRVLHVPLPVLRAVSFFLRIPNPMMSSLLSLGITLAEKGDTVHTAEGGFLPDPKVTVMSFLREARASPAVPML